MDMLFKIIVGGFSIDKVATPKVHILVQHILIDAYSSHSKYDIFFKKKKHFRRRYEIDIFSQVAIYFSHDDDSHE